MDASERTVTEIEVVLRMTRSEAYWLREALRTVHSHAHTDVIDVASRMIEAMNALKSL